MIRSTLRALSVASVLGAVSGAVLMSTSGAGAHSGAGAGFRAAAASGDRALAATPPDVAASAVLAEASTRQSGSLLLHRQTRAAADRAAAREATAARRAAEALARQRAVRSAVRDPRAVARLLAGDRGWSASQFRCLDKLWMRESGWKHRADNPASSAYGIPQALPGSRMAAAGPDWRTNPVTQIEWGLDYVSDRYGTPCAAWGHSESHNWY